MASGHPVICLTLGGPIILDNREYRFQSFRSRAWADYSRHRLRDAKARP